MFDVIPLVPESIYQASGSPNGTDGTSKVSGPVNDACRVCVSE